MKKIVIEFAHIETLFLIMSFLFAISVFNMAGYILPIMIAIVLFFQWNNIKIGVTDLLLAFFSASYFLFYYYYYGAGVRDIIIYLIGPIGSYIMAKLFVQYSKKDNAMMVFIVVLSAGMFLHGLLNFVTYIRSDYAVKYSYLRLAMDVWRKELVSVTCTGMYYTMAAGLSIGVLTSDFSKKIKRTAWIVLILSIIMTVYFANRTLLVIMAILFVYRYIVIIMTVGVSSNKKTLKFLKLLLLALLLLILLATNAFGIADKLSKLKLIGRLAEEALDTGRFKLWFSFFKDINFLKYPLGNNKLSSHLKVSYMHNLWLDIYDDVGVIPTMMFVLFTVKSIRRFFVFKKQLLKSKKVKEYFCFEYLMFAVLLNSMVEPIIEANPYFFLILIMFIGAMNGQINKTNYENKLYQ